MKTLDKSNLESILSQYNNITIDGKSIANYCTCLQDLIEFIETNFECYADSTEDIFWDMTDIAEYLDKYRLVISDEINYNMFLVEILKDTNLTV